jgi:glycosyltransferase involved in cell wall biosynthesis
VTTGPLRVALVLGPATDRVGQHVLSLVRGLVAGAAEVRLFASAAALSRFDFAGAGAATDELDIPATPGPRDVAVVSHLRRALRTGAVDVIHAHGLRAGMVAAIARPATTPLVVTWHQTYATHGLARLANRGLAPSVAAAADLTLAVSPELAASASRLGAREARPALLAAPALPPVTRNPAEVREEFGLTPQTPVVLTVGRLHVHERHDVLVSAAARWRSTARPTPTAIIVGTGPAYRDLAAQIIMARAPVVLAGQRADWIGDLLATAEVAVITSDGEERQLFAQQALIAGVPLVAAEEGGLPDLLGDAAVAVPVGDVDATDAAIRSLLADADRRARHVDAGRALAASWPTEADAVDLVVAAYAEVIGRTDALRP